MAMKQPRPRIIRLKRQHHKPITREINRIPPRRIRRLQLDDVGKEEPTAPGEDVRVVPVQVEGVREGKEGLDDYVDPVFAGEVGEVYRNEVGGYRGVGGVEELFYDGVSF